jgi:cytochrome c biogenesis protein CcmG/thiol:disulfide interchange protein DsbE
LLATQRLDEGRIRGLEGHLRYRICLRTFSPEESLVALGTRDAFELPPLPGRTAGEGGGLSRADLGGGEGPMLVNVFASWCVPCRIEHPLIARLAEEHGVTVHGLNYKDRPGAALAWLQEMGDPYAKIGSDQNGRVGIEWGVYGVPETFVIDKEGRVAYKHVGPLQPRDVERTILPLLEKLK